MVKEMGNGKCTEYDYDTGHKFEGEYLNGYRNGKFKGYDENGNLISEKEFLKGCLVN